MTNGNAWYVPAPPPPSGWSGTGRPAPPPRCGRAQSRGWPPWSAVRRFRPQAPARPQRPPPPSPRSSASCAAAGTCRASTGPTWRPARPAPPPRAARARPSPGSGRGTRRPSPRSPEAGTNLLIRPGTDLLVRHATSPPSLRLTSLSKLCVARDRLLCSTRTWPEIGLFVQHPPHPAQRPTVLSSTPGPETHRSIHHLLRLALRQTSPLNRCGTWPSNCLLWSAVRPQERLLPPNRTAPDPETACFIQHVLHVAQNWLHHPIPSMPCPEISCSVKHGPCPALRSSPSIATQPRQQWCFCMVQPGCESRCIVVVSDYIKDPVMWTKSAANHQIAFAKNDKIHNCNESTPTPQGTGPAGNKQRSV
ncbi:uncharacterized protein LOC142010122 [Carettochelys insculpta]|uniref:uncharacterized protein LOC142010122 n=1 Tax=Carettochelys insculpta TaxID=44489 RepID=UPI003EC1536D